MINKIPNQEADQYSQEFNYRLQLAEYIDYFFYKKWILQHFFGVQNKKLLFYVA